MHWSAEEVLPKLDVPVLILAGERDIVTLPEASQAMARSIPDARLIRVEGAGHMGFMERADVYNAAIADFAEEAFRRGEGTPADEPAVTGLAGGGAVRTARPLH
jgi:pimeloyl-ACP methyl ester carboxylesterase